jgi:hypothetical protein
MLTPGRSALSEIESRLTQIHNEQHFLRDEVAGLIREITAKQDRLTLLDYIETEYVALLAPTQEGIPA